MFALCKTFVENVFLHCTIFVKLFLHRAFFNDFLCPIERKKHESTFFCESAIYDTVRKRIFRLLVVPKGMDVIHTIYEARDCFSRPIHYHFTIQLSSFP